ncbi:hypothetical protein [Adhaeribacter terreus]
MGMILLYIFLTFGIGLGTTEAYKVSELRTYYQKASKCPETGQSFHKYMARYEGKEPVILGFKAVSEAVMAKHVWGPYSKLKHLKSSAALFDQAVTLDADNPEIRFLRYTVEYYIPRYLNMSSHVEQDKKIVMESLLKYPKSGLDAESYKLMRDFLLSSEHLNEAEKQQLRTIKT